MKWISPIDYKLVVTEDSHSYLHMKEGETGLPLPPHPGAFGVKRKNHIHEGVDLYCPEGTVVRSVNDGIVAGIATFTGENANSPWWEETYAALIHTDDGIVVYGEIEFPFLLIGSNIYQGDKIGKIKRVLKNDKGRPMSMLHFELYKKYPGAIHGHHPLVEWQVDKPQPENLLNPTQFLLESLS